MKNLDFFITLSNFKNLEEDNEEAMDVEDDEDISVKLFILNVTGVNGGDLLTTYGDEIVSDEAWDETTEFLISNEVKEYEVEKSEILIMNASSIEMKRGKEARRVK